MVVRGFCSVKYGSGGFDGGLDSRLRGNDVGGCGNDVGGCGNGSIRAENTGRE